MLDFSKQTIIMIHGFRGTHHGLLLIAKHLRPMKMIIPDLPGFGKGPTIPAYHLDGYVDWLHGFITKQRLTELPILLGHSFGSIICTAYAARYPKTISRLILVNPIATPALNGPNRLMTRLATAYYKIGAALPDKAGQRWLASKPIVRLMSVVMAKTKDKPLRRFIHDQHDRYFSRFHSADSLLQSYHTSVEHTVGEFALRIPVPTLLIAGTLDDITPLNDQYALAKKFPQATLKIINDVGHLTHYETPDVVAGYVQAFIKSR